MGREIYATNKDKNATLSISNSIIGQTDTSIADLEGNADGSGSNNLFPNSQINGPTFTNTIISDPLLGPLQDNGSGILTHNLDKDSDAIDNGTTSVFQLIPLVTDQRLYAPRIFGASVDIGAFEYGATAPPPELSTPSDQTALEGESRGFSLGELTDLNRTNSYVVTLNWGDGSADTTFSMDNQGSLPQQIYNYANEGTYTVTLSATDADGKSNTTTFDVVVDSKQPVLTNPGDQSADEGVETAFNLGSLSDANSSGSYVVKVNWGDGNSDTIEPASLGNQTFNHTYTNDSTYTVTASATDADGDSNEITFNVVVANSPPVLTAPADQTTTEGADTTFDIGSLADANNSNSYDVTVNWGDGSALTTFTTTSVGTLTAQKHTYANDGFYNVYVTAKDADGGPSASLFRVTVFNTPPVLTSPSDQTATEGASGTFDLGSLADQFTSGDYTVTVNWGDGTAPNSEFTQTTTGPFSTLDHTFTADGTYTVTVSAVESDVNANNPSNVITFEVIVANTLPVLTAPTGTQTSSEGSETSFNLGSLADPFTSGDYIVTVNWGDGSSNSTFTMTAPGTLPAQDHKYVNDDTFTVTVSAVESDVNANNPSNEITFDVVVTNVLPTITLVANQSGTTNLPTEINVGSFADPGVADSPWQVSIDFGDGTDAVEFEQDSTGDIPVESHKYAKAGTYTVTVSVNDGSGTTTSTSEVVVRDDLGSKIVVGGASTVKTFNADGKLNNEINPFGNDYTGTVRVVEGDVNGDGTPDLIVSTGPVVQNLVRIIDGQSREVVEEFSPFEASFTGGIFVAFGDLNRDGHGEIIVTADIGGGPRVRVYDGSTLEPVADFFGIEDSNFRGGAHAAVGDINNDGIGDLIITAGAGGGPRVAVYEGSSVAKNAPVKLVNDFFAYDSNLRTGITASAGDVDGDGFADLAFSSEKGGAPHVKIFSGSALTNANANEPSLLANFFAGDSSERDGVRIAAKYLDDDNQADIVTGEGDGSGTRVLAYLGTELVANGNSSPASLLDFDAFDGIDTGVFVG
ncbi:MAG: PKD domain-containing protein [Gemmataceae bacterium]